MTTNPAPRDPQNRQEVEMITVWSQPECSPCQLLKRKLDKEGVAFEEKDLTDPEHQEKLEQFREEGLTQTPIVETPTETWSGLNPTKLDTAIAQAHQASPTGLSSSPVVQTDTPGVS